MASKAQIAANRRNARRSTGPRSAAGKSQVSRNALRHGLAARTVEGASTDRIRQLTKAIIGKGPHSEAIEGHARNAAEAQHDIERSRRLRAVMFQQTETEVQPYHSARARRSMVRLKKRVEGTAPEVLGGERKRAILDSIAMQEMAESPWRPENEADRQAVLLHQIARRLERVDRYERRALSRRRRALNDLLEAQRLADNAGDGGPPRKVTCHAR